MKVLLMTIPIEVEPSPFPPLACLSLLQYLRKHGFADLVLYNIDAVRPSYPETLEYIKTQNPDVLGISAVVSTAYGYTKKFTLDIKKILPNTLIVVGGNLAANAEILLKKTGTDLCVLGEGEEIFLNIVRRAQTTRNPVDYRDILGLVFQDENGNSLSTGYAPPIPVEAVYDIDWKDLEKSADIGIYIYPALEMSHGRDWWIKNDDRTFQPHRRNKNVATLSAGKGCINRCTFCHRWDRGIRYIPVDVIMQRLEILIHEYQVGFVDLHIECFGIDKNWFEEFCRKIKAYDILWRTWGVRTDTVTPEFISAIKEAGCVCCVCGHETGSARMLKIMEKNTTLRNNYDAIHWIVSAGMATVFQLCVGLPGENRDTIFETIQMLKYGTTLKPWQNPNIMIISFAMALTGTPLYEYGRQVDLIGRELDSEEKYLLRISNPESHLAHRTINFSECSDLERLSWAILIPLAVKRNYIIKYGLDHFKSIVEFYWNSKAACTGYGAEGPEVHPVRQIFKMLKTIGRKNNTDKYCLLPEKLLPHVAIFLKLMEIKKNQGLVIAVKMLKDHLLLQMRTIFRINKKLFSYQPAPLRNILLRYFNPIPSDNLSMEPLRKGR